LYIRVVYNPTLKRQKKEGLKLNTTDNVIDIPSVVVFERNKIKNIPIDITIKNLKNYSTINDVKKHTYPRKNVSINTINEIQNILKSNDKYPYSIEAKIPRKQRKYFPLKPKIIHILLFKNSNIHRIETYLKVIKSKYGKEIKIIIHNLENICVPHKSPTSQKWIENPDYIALTIILENIRIFNYQLYNHICENIGYKCSYRKIGIYRIVKPETVLTKKLLRGKKNIINDIINYEKYFCVSYGCGFGDVKLGGYLPRSLKKNRDIEIDGKISNKLQFINVCEYSTIVSYLYSCCQSNFNNHYHIINEMKKLSSK